MTGQEISQRILPASSPWAGGVCVQTNSMGRECCGVVKIPYRPAVITQNTNSSQTCQILSLTLREGKKP